MGAKRGFSAAVAAVLVVAAVAAAGLSLATSGAAGGPAARSAAAQRPNVIVVLTDDLAWNLVQYMPHVRHCSAAGASFGSYFVTDSLCCPSRSSIFTGRFPHDTGIFTNVGNDGGFRRSSTSGWEKSTYRHRSAGRWVPHRLRGQVPQRLPARDLDGQQHYVPPGWNDWDLTGNGYAEYNYTLNDNHKLDPLRVATGDYLVRRDRARRRSHFISTAAAQTSRSCSSWRRSHRTRPTRRRGGTPTFPGLQAPRGPAFNHRDVARRRGFAATRR